MWFLKNFTKFDEKDDLKKKLTSAPDPGAAVVQSLLQLSPWQLQYFRP